jgi:hypothetical protein
MRTKKQKLAARINGRKSKGPVTPEGKARSSQNAITHGIHARSVVLSTENPEKYDQLRAAYFDYWQPSTVFETDLVNDLAISRWRLNRLLANETAAIDREIDRQRDAIKQEFKSIDECTRTALAYTTLADEGRTLVTFGRSETRYRRAIDRATDKLLLLKSRKYEKEQKEPGHEQPEHNQYSAPIFTGQQPEQRQ